MTAELRALTNLARAATAGSAEVSGLLGRLCASIAETFGFERLDAYRYLSGSREVVGLGERLEVESLAPLFAEALESGRPLWREGRLVVPLAADHVVGFLATECADEPTQRECELLTTYGALTAGFLQRALEHEESERLGSRKSQFIALASHELRTPAAVIHGIAQTVQLRAAELPPEQLASLHDTLAAHTTRMTCLIDELLDLSRLEAKAVALERVRLPVRERVEEIVEGVAGDQREDVHVDVPEELTALVDPRAFERIVANLVTNALRYGEPPVDVRAVQADRHFRLTVEDHGDGVAPGFVPRLFERFSRASADGGKTGTGLGLSIAQSYAQAQGGQLFYEDADPRGARFQFVLPSPQE